MNRQHGHCHVVAAAAALLAAAGCREQAASWARWDLGANAREAAHQAPAATDGAPVLAPANAAPPSDQVLHVIHFQFDVLRIDILDDPTGHGRKLWNHADELRVDPAQAALLARNGVRMGVAPRGAWPALQTIIDAVHPKLTRAAPVLAAGAPLTIELADIKNPEPLFRYNQHAALVGGTVEKGRKAVQIAYQWDPRRASQTELVVSFVIARGQAGQTWDVLTGQPVSESDRTVFDELTCVLVLQEDEFLVMGAGADVANPFLVGPRFFSGEGSGRRRETLLLVTPRPVRSAVESRAGS